MCVSPRSTAISAKPRISSGCSGNCRATTMCRWCRRGSSDMTSQSGVILGGKRGVRKSDSHVFEIGRNNLLRRRAVVYVGAKRCFDFRRKTLRDVRQRGFSCRRKIGVFGRPRSDERLLKEEMVEIKACEHPRLE